LTWCLAAGAGAAPAVVGDSQVALNVEADTGVITSLQDKASGLVLAPPEGLAESFRLILAMPDGAFRTILGKDQTLSTCGPAGDALALTWAGPLRDTSGATHDLSARMDIKVAGGALSFTLHVENHTPGKLQEAWYPLVGGLTGLHAPGAAPDASLWVPTSTPWEKPVALPFGEAVFGYPGQMNLSFTCLQSKSLGRSLYFASEDPVARYKYYRFMELPGAGGSDVVACLQHVPLTPPGGTFDGSPVVMRFVEGGWREAGKVYRQWFLDTFGIPRLADDWIRRQSFFLMTMFMLPEGTINYTFRDIPSWAKSARDHGLTAVQISGWQMGGHDNGYPAYTPDPRLGTWQELEDGIRACHRMGVKVYFFANYQAMMVDSDWYKTELSKYRWMAGWGMGTLWARMGHPKLMTWADPAFPQFRKIIVDQFAALAKIGGDGVHVDKMFPSALEYNPDAPLSPDTATWEGAAMLSQEIMTECRKYNPDWGLSFECNWDRMLQFGAATWWVGNQLITRQVFPENVETTGVYQAYDYLGVNNLVRDGHAVMVAPMNFCRSMDWAPFRGLADYIKDVKAIRDKLQDTVFLGEVLGATQVTFEGPVPDGVQYTVHRNRASGRRACILTDSKSEARTVTLKGFDQPAGSTVRIHMPGRASRVAKLPTSFTIPAERIAFVEELGGNR
jgi:hypothetical protein